MQTRMPALSWENYRRRQNSSGAAGTRLLLGLLPSSRQFVLRFCLKVPGVMALMQLT